MAKTKNTSPKMLPNNLEAEQATLCSVLIDSLAAENVMALLDSSDFYSETHKMIFDAMKSLYVANKPIDFVSVVDVLDKREELEAVGGISYITTLSNVVPSGAYHAHYSQIVKRDSILRQLIESCSKIEAKAYEAGDTDILAEAEKTIYEIGTKGTVSTLRKMGDTFSDAMNTFDEINRNGGMSKGVRSGFIALDKKTGGFQKTDLIILAARPGIGKTSLAMNIVSNAAIEDGARCAIFSLEMGREQLAQRMLCSVAGVNMERARNGSLTEQDWTKLWKAHKKLENAQIYCDDNSMNKPSQILNKCRKLKRERGLDLIVVDYLQLMTGDTKTDNRQNEVAEMSRSMKVLAKEIDVPVIVLSQLSRKATDRDTPVLSDLRESGAIEQDADMVIFINRQDPAETQKSDSFIANLIIAKFRNGQPGTVNVGWDGSKVSFVNLTGDENDKSLEKAYEEMHGSPVKNVVTDEDMQMIDDLPMSEIPQEYIDAMESSAPPEVNPEDMGFPPIEDVFKN